MAIPLLSGSSLFSTFQNTARVRPMSGLLVDATSVFAFQQFLKDRDFPVSGNPNYGNLIDVLRKEFPENDFDPMLAFVAISFDNEGQKKFVTFLHHQGFIVDVTDYRDAFILPERTNPYQRFSTRITYVAGLLAAKRANLIVVTDAFDTYYPLLDFVQTRKGKVTIAFFRSGMEARWQRVGLFDDDSAIKFVDLEPHAKAIVGVDLGSKKGRDDAKMGLGSLKV
jgi:hypothetical protein